MGLKFDCKSCGKEIKVRFLKAGDAAKCKRCGADCEVPPSANNISSDVVAQIQAEERLISSSAGIQQTVDQSSGSDFDSEDTDMVLGLIADGKSEEEIVQMLVQKGQTNAEASAFVREIIDAMPESGNSADAYRRKMLSGALWAIGGTAVTAITYQAAQDGGVYIIAWGAIVFGAWDFLCGLVGYLNCSESDVDANCSQEVESESMSS